jgi:hypothetical protein
MVYSSLFWKSRRKPDDRQIQSWDRMKDDLRQAMLPTGWGWAKPLWVHVHLLVGCWAARSAQFLLPPRIWCSPQRPNADSPSIYKHPSFFPFFEVSILPLRLLSLNPHSSSESQILLSLTKTSHFQLSFISEEH